MSFFATSIITFFAASSVHAGICPPNCAPRAGKTMTCVSNGEDSVTCDGIVYKSVGPAEATNKNTKPKGSTRPPNYGDVYHAPDEASDTNQ